MRSIRTPSPIALATRVPNTAKAIKLKNAAQITAIPGDSTQVETTVAYGVRRVMEAIDVIKNERKDYEDDDEGEGSGHVSLFSFGSPSGGLLMQITQG